MSNPLDGLLDALRKASSIGPKEPIFILKDHPDIKELFTLGEQQAKFFKKRAKDLEDESTKFADEHWEKVRAAALTKGVDLKKDFESCSVIDGVLFGERKGSH
jgi:hypothetical protein